MLSFIPGKLMKAHVTFDTLEFVETLKKGGVEDKKAEALSRATNKALNQFLEAHNLVTVEILQSELLSLEKRIYTFIVKSLSWAVSILIGMQSLFHFLGK